MQQQFESTWTLNDEVGILFPGNGIINRAKIIKISFSASSYEPLYDVEVPFGMDGVLMHARLHGLKEWHLRSPQEGHSTLNDIIRWIDEEVNFIKKTENYTPSEYERGFTAGLKQAKIMLEGIHANQSLLMKKIKATITYQSSSDVVKKGDSCVIEMPNFKGYSPDYTETNRNELKKFWGQLADAECSVVFDFELP